MTRCQICGRRQGLRANGTIRFHHVASRVCAGAGFAPIELDDDRLERCVAVLTEELSVAVRALRILRESRANFIPPELTERRARIEGELVRLERRLKRHRNWPARFRRQMERDGWGDRPPAYLLEREAQLSGL